MWGMYIGAPHILTELLLEGFLLFIHGVSFFLALCRLSGKSHPYVQFLIWLPWTNAGEAVSRCYFRIKLLHGFLGWQHQWKGRVRASTVHHPFLHTLLSDLTQSCSSNSLSWVQLFPSEDQVASIFTGRWSDVLVPSFGGSIVTEYHESLFDIPIFYHHLCMVVATSCMVVAQPSCMV